MVQVVGKDQSAVKRVTCKQCASILEYTPSEVKKQEGRDISGGPDGREWINCPSCDHKVILRSW